MAEERLSTPEGDEAPREKPQFRFIASLKDGSVLSWTGPEADPVKFWNALSEHEASSSVAFFHVLPMERPSQ